MQKIELGGVIVYGVNLSACTGCKHYASPLDIVAIQFKCCGAYFACYSCHLEICSHAIERWTPAEFNQRAILCGRCTHLLTITEYLASGFHCIYCQAPFNPKCQGHWDLYFELGT